MILGRDQLSEVLLVWSSFIPGASQTHICTHTFVCICTNRIISYIFGLLQAQVDRKSGKLPGIVSVLRSVKETHRGSAGRCKIFSTFFGSFQWFG